LRMKASQQAELNLKEYELLQGASEKPNFRSALRTLLAINQAHDDKRAIELIP
jgi:hypothetical protein